MDTKELIELVQQLERRVMALEEELGAVAEHIDEMEDAISELAEDMYGEDQEEDFDVECPGCGELIQIDLGTLQEGSVECPGCDETLEFEFGCDCDDCAGEGCK